MVQQKVLFNSDECDYILSHAETFEPYSYYKQPEFILELDDQLKSMLFDKFKVFGLQYFPAYIKFLRYHEGIHFNLHRDSKGEDGRIKTISLQLSNSDDYEGGDLHIRQSEHIVNSTNSSYHFNRDKGNAIIYSAQQLHEVTKITKGVRYVMVTWLQHYHLKLDKTFI